MMLPRIHPGPFPTHYRNSKLLRSDLRDSLRLVHRSTFHPSSPASFTIYDFVITKFACNQKCNRCRETCHKNYYNLSRERAKWFLLQTQSLKDHQPWSRFDFFSVPIRGWKSVAICLVLLSEREKHHNVCQWGLMRYPVA